MEDKYIYSKADFEEAIQQGLKDSFGYELVNFLKEQITEQLKYVNIFRFYERNCCGCVGSNTECDFTYGRGEAKGCWDKAKKGELFDCPVRTNGTMILDPKKGKNGLQSVDISDRDKPPYPIIV